MEEKVLDSFPFDSMNVLNEESGQMEPDREYEAKIFSNYFKKFLSNGVYFGEYNNYKENSMKVELDGGMNIKVLPGAGIIEGVDFENEEEAIFTLDRPVTGSRIDRVVVQLNNSLDTRATKLYIKQGNSSGPAELQRDANIYEICIAEVTTNDASNISVNDIKDTRMNKVVCGVVSSLITIDGEEIINEYKAYVDSIYEELVRKDQNIVLEEGCTINDSDGRGLSKNDFTDVLRKKLEDLSNTIVMNRLDSSSAFYALSAAMGKKLNEEKQGKIRIGNTTPVSNQLAEGEIYLQYFD